MTLLREQERHRIEDRGGLSISGSVPTPSAHRADSVLVPIGRQVNERAIQTGANRATC